MATARFVTAAHFKTEEAKWEPYEISLEGLRPLAEILPQLRPFYRESDGFVPAEYLPTGYSQVAPITLHIKQEDSLFVVTCEESTMYGEGANLREALSNFYELLMADVAWLMDQGDDLGRGLSDELNVLRKFFRSAE